MGISERRACFIHDLWKRELSNKHPELSKYKVKDKWAAQAEPSEKTGFSRRFQQVPNK